MPSYTMLTAVLQATALLALSAVIKHYTFENAFSPVEQYQEQYKANQTIDRIKDEAMQRDYGPNITVQRSNDTLTVDPAEQDHSKFWTKEFPQTVFAYVVLGVVRYWWLIWLERILPARPRPTGPAAPRAEKEDDDSREEEVIRKWVEAGRIRRASLSWGNTFGKWMLDLFVGNLWYGAIDVLLDSLFRLKWPWNAFDKWEVPARWFINFFGVQPLAALVGFILIPAHKRIVFEGAMDLAMAAFLGAFFHVVVPWAMTKEFVQEILRNATDAEQGNRPTMQWSGTRLDEAGDEL